MTEADKEQHTEESTPLNTARLSTPPLKRSDFQKEPFSPARTRLAAPLLVEIYGRTLSRPNSFSSKEVFVDFITNLVSLNTLILSLDLDPSSRSTHAHGIPLPPINLMRLFSFTLQLHTFALVPTGKDRSRQRAGSWRIEESCPGFSKSP